MSVMTGQPIMAEITSGVLFRNPSGSTLSSDPCMLAARKPPESRHQMNWAGLRHGNLSDDTLPPWSIPHPYLKPMHVPQQGSYPCPENSRRLPDVGVMFGQRRRRWPNIKPTLGQRVIFAEYPLKAATTSVISLPTSATHSHYFEEGQWKQRCTMCYKYELTNVSTIW